MWELIGKLCVGYIVAKLLFLLWRFIRSYFLPRLGLTINIKSYGDWAVVTGATDGIGKAYAMELARLGVKTVLISRSQEKLDKVASEIKEACGTETKTVAYDFGNPKGYEVIQDALSGLQIGILVNNVGMSYEHPEYFDEVSANTVEKMVYVNILSAVKMTHLVLKGMVERKKGIVIMVSSASANVPIPLLSVYSSSKAFMDFFGRALQTEYRCKGIICQSLCPFFVATKLAAMKPSLFVPEPTAYVKAALGTLGNADRSHGYFFHEIQASVASLMPYFVTQIHALSMMMKVRARALRKKSKEN